MKKSYTGIFILSILLCLTAKAEEKKLDTSNIGELEDLAISGNQKARDVLVGYYLKEGSSHYVPKNAIALLEKVAENNNGDAMVLLGKFYLYGASGIKKDRESARYWFEQAYNSGSMEGATLYADMYFNEKRYSAAFNIYEDVARNLHEPQPRVQWLVSSMLTQGLGIEKNFEVAHLYASHSATNGYAEAQKDLGINYSQGRGVKRNMRLAKFWLKKAAEQDHKVAHSMLGAIYVDSKKYKKGIQHYGRAIELGHTLSCKLLNDVQPKARKFQPKIDEATKVCE